MATIIVNDKDDFYYNSRKRKARAIVLDENNNIYVCYMNGCYMLPGGGVEIDEHHYDTILRELYEELGIKDADVRYFMTVKYFHENYPKYNSKNTQTRLQILYYYICKVDSKLIGQSHLTDYETNHNMEIRKYRIEDLIEEMEKYNDNPYKKFADKETLFILDLYLKNLEIKQENQLTKVKKNVKINS